MPFIRRSMNQFVAPPRRRVAAFAGARFGASFMA